MKMKEPPQVIMDSFRDFMAENDNQPSKDQIRQFVNVSIHSMMPVGTFVIMYV